MGWSDEFLTVITLPSGATTGARIVVDGESDRILIYDAAGNLAASIAATDGTDPAGNHYVSGVAVYNETSGLFSQLASGFQQFGQIVGGVPDKLNASQLTPGPESFGITSPDASALGADAKLFTSFVSGNTGVPVPSGNEPVLKLSSLSASSVASLELSGAVVKVDSLGLRYTWQAPAMGSGWVTGPGIAGSYPPLQYHLLPLDMVHVFGTFHANTTTPGTILGTGLPAVNQTTLGGVGVAGGAVRMSSAGGEITAYLNNTGQLRAAALPATIAVNDTFMINAVIPLGNIA